MRWFVLAFVGTSYTKEGRLIREKTLINFSSWTAAPTPTTQQVHYPLSWKDGEGRRLRVWSEWLLKMIILWWWCYWWWGEDDDAACCCCYTGLNVVNKQRKEYNAMQRSPSLLSSSLSLFTLGTNAPQRFIFHWSFTSHLTIIGFGFKSGMPKQNRKIANKVLHFSSRICYYSRRLSVSCLYGQDYSIILRYRSKGNDGKTKEEISLPFMHINLMSKARPFIHCRRLSEP